MALAWLGLQTLKTKITTPHRVLSTYKLQEEVIYIVENNLTVIGKVKMYSFVKVLRSFLASFFFFLEVGIFILEVTSFFWKWEVFLEVTSFFGSGKFFWKLLLFWKWEVFLLVTSFFGSGKFFLEVTPFLEVGSFFFW